MKKLLWLFVTIIILIIPIILWSFKTETEMNIVIINKTVPDQSYREHKGLTWLLNHEKVIKPLSKQRYDTGSDYYGFFPMENEGDEIRSLPNELEEVDLIYIADTYGVYDEESNNERPEKIYGGITLEEISTIKEVIYNDQATLIAEFNSFASPTQANARDELTDLLALDWTGWTGRYFQELDPTKTDEIAEWMLNQYQQQEDNPWSFSGSGFVFIHEDGSVVVLEEGVDIGKGGMKLSFTEAGQSFFELKKSPDYYYWFDIVQAHNAEDILAFYDWDLTKKGEEQLRSHEIPTSFPAIIKSTKFGNPTYYFAGDYVDVANVPTYYQYKWLTAFKNWFSFNTPGNTETFYWKTYVPMMQTILADIKNQRKLSINDNLYHPFENDYGFHSSRLHNGSFQFYRDGTWNDFLIKGVNMGIAKPGSWPGETAITEEEYYRWFEQIGEMNANVIRVYTLHPPGFYRALQRYNRNHAEPLFLFHGTWIEEKGLEESLDAFDSHNLEPFKKEISNVIDAIHGNIFLEDQPGHASGQYTADVSPYVIGWILGIEWYPQMVLNTNELHQEIGEFDGQHVYTDGAEPFEYWLADIFNYTITYELDEYRWQRPISFTNWVTTDLLEHPSEPSIEEDLVGIDPNVIYLKEHIKTGQFASYHVYPYYPDFMNYEPQYLDYIDHRGENNTYAAYLNDLNKAHNIPVLIAEFGVPSSRGITHQNPFGWNQGFLSEQEQGEINARLFEDVIHEGLLGGIVFAWQDEWFKRTWNTMELDNKDRRPYWSNAQTNEQNFGLLSFDQLKISLSGKKSEWNNEPLYEKQSTAADGTDEERELKAFYVDHDERYLYLRLDFEEIKEVNPFENMNTLILIDSIDNQGIKEVPFNTQVNYEDNGIDFLIHLNGLETSRVLVDSYYDMFYYQYGHQLQMIPTQSYAKQKNNGIFHPIDLAINKEMIIPSTNQVIPFESYETGKLRHGNANPNSSNYDSLADFHVSSNEDMMELRLPWLLLNVKDPSLKEITGDLWTEDGLKASRYIDGITFSVLTFKPDANGEAIALQNNGKLVTDSFPELEQNVIRSSKLKTYQWEKWEKPISQERLKQSYYILQQLFKQYN